MSGSHVTDCYLQLEADIWTYLGDDRVRAIKVVGFTQKRPTRPRPGSVVVKIELQLPDAAFLPLRPEVRVVVPEDLTEMQSVVVEAVAP